MRAAHRAVVVVPAILLSVIAVPAYAGDGSPSLLDTLGSTVDTVTAPILKPQAAPAGPVTQLTTIVDSTLRTSLSSVPEKVDTVVAGPTTTVVELPAAPVVNGSLPEVAAATPADRIVTARPAAGTFAAISFTAAPRVTSVASARTAAAHIPGTSTLPDGGSPLTPAWLVLCVSLTAAGVVVIRRSRAA